MSYAVHLNVVSLNPVEDYQLLIVFDGTVKNCIFDTDPDRSFISYLVYINILGMRD